MKKILFFLIVAVLICPSAFSETKTIVREVKGRGVSRDEAIRNALYEAVAQAKGVKVDSGEYTLGYQAASASVDREGTRRGVDFDAVSVRTGGTLRRTASEGLVKTYEVLDEKKIDENTYEVTLKVWVFDYQGVDKSDRLRLAVMPIKTLEEVYVFGDLEMSNAILSQQLSQKLSVGLTETNKFAVLDREYIQDFAVERNIQLSGDTELEEKAKLGKVLGADYMLVGTISNARVRIREKSASIAIGRPLREYEADFIFDYRLIVGPTRQVKLAEVVNIAMKTDEIKQLVKKWEPNYLDFREMADNLISMVAEQVVETIIDRLYPIRIASIDENGVVIINQGGRRIAKGQLLEVVVQGKEIIDFDTKESLGKTEILVATIKIDRVAPRISYAKLVKGDAAKISEGLICRIKRSGAKAIKGAKSTIERTSKGGVKLPFE